MQNPLLLQDVPEQCTKQPGNALYEFSQRTSFFLIYKSDPVQLYNLCIGRLHGELLWPAPVTMTTAMVLKTGLICTCWNKKGRRMLKLPMIGVTIVSEYLKNIKSQNWYKGNATSHYTHSSTDTHWPLLPWPKDNKYTYASFISLF